MARTDREQRLIQRFVDAFNAERAAKYKINSWPDTDSRAKAIDAAAVDGNGNVLAIEHTLIQPFVGERDDSEVLIRGVGTLDKKKSLLRAGFDVTLTIEVGAVPKGPDWRDVATKLEAWYEETFADLPLGRSQHQIPGLSFVLNVDVDKERTTGEAHFFIERWMPGEPVDAVVRTALREKLPKLLAADAHLRVLLLEKNSLPRSPDEIGQAIENLRAEFPQLDALDEAWVINTVVWPTEDYCPSYFVWPRPLARSRRVLKNLAKRRERLAQAERHIRLRRWRNLRFLKVLWVEFVRVIYLLKQACRVIRVRGKRVVRRASR